MGNLLQASADYEPIAETDNQLASQGIPGRHPAPDDERLQDHAIGTGRSGHTVQEVFDEIVTLLDQHLRVPDAFNTTPGFYSASLVTSQETLLVSVLIRPEDDIVSVSILNRD